MKKNMTIAIERIKKAQEILKEKYSTEDYNKYINQLLKNGNVEILITIAQDSQNTADLRMFALAAMGE